MYVCRNVCMYVCMYSTFVGEPKVKLYQDVNGELKGDGLCCYLKASCLCLTSWLCIYVRAV